MKKWVFLLIGVQLLACASLSGAQEASKRWGVGTFLAYNIPIFQLKNRFSPTSKYGASWQYMLSARRYMEVEYHRSTFLNGKLAKKPFKWSVDNQEYVSPNATSEMKFNSLAMNLLLFHPREPKFQAKRSAHYLEVGIGFYNYRAENRNFIYPGQTIKPLNTGQVLQPQIDSKTALSVNVGYGVQAFAWDNVAIDLRARYNMVMGDLRPMFDWGIQNKTFPMHLFDIGAGLRFYFWD